MSEININNRIRRLYASLDYMKERDMESLPAKITIDHSVIEMYQDFSGRKKPEDLENDAYQIINNIANIYEYLNKWAELNNKDKSEVDEVLEKSEAIKIVRDLWNSDKHPYPRRDGGYSKLNPKLQNIRRVIQLQTKAEKGSYIQMTHGKGGIPYVSGNGSSVAVLTGEIVDNNEKIIGDFRSIILEAVRDWETAFSEFGILNKRKIEE